ncbi:hypothetical protein MLD38_040094 [Melastoma candidum]|uniref:Uncharacterized protein n=1 Tax=Melastoma candidum TaxID=119954 RepID=A0ACB9L4A9_9MYRT|nr:hypothetical protein MLD38_040094 [Melastoma candidum]
MAAALECWSSRSGVDGDDDEDDDMLEQVLVPAQVRSESAASSSSTAAGGTKESPSLVQKKLQRLSRNVSEAIASLKNSLSLDSQASTASPTKMEACRKVVWGSVVRSLTHLYPGSQLPEKLVSNIRKHFDSLPLSYAQAGFDMKDVFLHIKLMEQASTDDRPAMVVQEVLDDDGGGLHGCFFKLVFACNSLISWPAMSTALDNASICCKKIQIFEKKGFTLGILLLLVQDGLEKMFLTRMENALKLAMRKSRLTTVRLPFGLCGCQEGEGNGIELGLIEEDGRKLTSNRGNGGGHIKVQLGTPLAASSFVVLVNEWQTIQSGGDEIEKWLLDSDYLEFIDQLGSNTFKGTYKGRRVGIEKLKGCEKGNSFGFELRKDLLELMTSGHNNIVQFIGVCIDEAHGLCVVTKFMEGGSVHELMMKNKKIQMKEVIRVAIDVAEALQFMNGHGVAYRDLNTQRILLDRHGGVCLADMGIVTVCKGIGDAMEYETDGYRWLAPEIIAGDPETVAETWMSNAYSFGMVVWEMVSGEAAYSAYSPVQAAVGIAASGLRPEIPKDCPAVLRSLMNRCWNNCPTRRPTFPDVLSMLLQCSDGISFR